MSSPFNKLWKARSRLYRSRFFQESNITHFATFCQISEGSFSAVSKPIFASKHAVGSIFEALQDLHIFEPLQTQHFSNAHRIQKRQNKTLPPDLEARSSTRSSTGSASRSTRRPTTPWRWSRSSRRRCRTSSRSSRRPRPRRATPWTAWASSFVCSNSKLGRICFMKFVSDFQLSSFFLYFPETNFLENSMNSTIFVAYSLEIWEPIFRKKC